jgi:hypothetical protein
MSLPAAVGLRTDRYGVGWLAPEESDPPMTLQVALVGTDGIVLASDQKWGATVRRTWATFMASKIRIDHKRGIAVTCARSDAGVVAARMILSRFKPGEEHFQYPLQPLEELGDEAFREVAQASSFPLSEGDVLVVFSRDLEKVYHLTVGRNSTCRAITDKVFAGHDINPAIYFAERHYQRLLIEDLAFLAAHTILMGAKLNPSGIHGLEMIFCRPDGFTAVSETKLNEYRRRSEQLDTQLNQTLIAGANI